jgi:hypothetical protein
MIRRVLFLKFQSSYIFYVYDVPDGFNGFRDSFVATVVPLNSSNVSFVPVPGLELSDINLTKRLGPFVPQNSQFLLLADITQNHTLF